MADVVVGVDGSSQSIEALRWAAGEAQARRTLVRVVCAWMYPPLGVIPLTPDPILPGELTRAAEETLWKAVAEAGVDPALTRFVTRQGPAARMLLAEARDADLLVVGARGLGGFRELLLGSVSHQCVQHAPCPVVVVRGS